jgi:predicted transcriptional regulator
MIFLREKCREREWVDYGEEKKKGSGEKGVGG